MEELKPNTNKEIYEIWLNYQNNATLNAQRPMLNAQCFNAQAKGCATNAQATNISQDRYMM
ncbi:uncharacterized protein PADG_11315 [Paracoccidioides brasiliensis Pb18]|uniref:Uncharacterized protein n=1 Tax=Paracoccidioides brasiliensis (strain Pb18) TaxID=502780 RepID=A0A0A0HVS2_PARBD|nr:uncharacterized protein PADG_11315 [Paracoccidioides brasiliensis Pb18]KGM92493.1 hypothetical protein PADG_11315 [Paracoccidioides brasiliensis Pb18]